MGSTTRRHRRASHHAGHRVNPDVTGEHTALVARLHAGDTDAFDRLYREQVAAVSRYVAARLGGPARDGVDDCVHDAFCDALANPALVQTDVLGSLLRLAARAVTRHIQSARSQRRHLRAVYTVYEDTTGSAPAMVGQLRISHALANLSDQQRRAVHLRYLDGYPRARVAELMGRSVGAVRSLERQAMACLKADLTGDGLGDTTLAAVLARRA